jgi:hypothetical protein
VTHLEIAKHTKALDEIAAEGLADIERAYQDAMARIASLADGDVAPVEEAPDREASEDPAIDVTARAA